MRAQQVGGPLTAAFDVEGVVHRTGRMILGGIQRGEVEPVGLDFGPLSDLEAHGTEDGLQTLHGQGHRVQSTLPALTTRQGHVQRFGLELGLQLCIGQCLTARRQGRFDGLLGLVDGGTAGLLFLDREGTHALHQLGDLARFTQVLGLGILKISRCARPRECVARAVNQCVQLVHVSLSLMQ